MVRGIGLTELVIIAFIVVCVGVLALGGLGALLYFLTNRDDDIPEQ